MSLEISNSIINNMDDIHRKTDEFLKLIQPIPKQIRIIKKLAKKAALG